MAQQFRKIENGEQVVSAWATVTVALALLHFIVPFFFLMSRHIKRNTTTLMHEEAYSNPTYEWSKGMGKQ